MFPGRLEWIFASLVVETDAQKTNFEKIVLAQKPNSAVAIARVKSQISSTSKITSKVHRQRVRDSSAAATSCSVTETENQAGNSRRYTSGGTNSNIQAGGSKRSDNGATRVATHFNLISHTPIIRELVEPVNKVPIVIVDEPAMNQVFGLL